MASPRPPNKEELRSWSARGLLTVSRAARVAGVSRNTLRYNTPQLRCLEENGIRLYFREECEAYREERKRSGLPQVIRFCGTDADRIRRICAYFLRVGKDIAPKDLIRLAEKHAETI